MRTCACLQCGEPREDPDTVFCPACRRRAAQTMADSLMADDPACPACGVPFVEHIGLIGTCAKLQAAELTPERARLVRMLWRCFRGWELGGPAHMLKEMNELTAKYMRRCPDVAAWARGLAKNESKDGAK